MKMMAMIHQLK